MNKHSPGSSKPVKLYGLPVSGHAHRVELMLAFLDIPYEKIDVDLMNGAHKAPDFLNLNLFGQIPVIDDNGDIVSDSTAILVYLAKNTAVAHGCRKTRLPQLRFSAGFRLPRMKYLRGPIPHVWSNCLVCRLTTKWRRPRPKTCLRPWSRTCRPATSWPAVPSA